MSASKDEGEPMIRSKNDYKRQVILPQVFLKTGYFHEKIFCVFLDFYA